MLVAAGCDCAGYESRLSPDGGADGDSDSDSDADTDSWDEPPPPSCLEATGVIDLSEPGDIVYGIRAAADQEGRLWAAWWAGASVYTGNLIARRCEPGEGWLRPDLLGPGHVGDLATGADGTAFLLSTEDKTMDKSARRWTIGGGWEEPELLEAQTGVMGGEHLAVAGNGTVMSLREGRRREPEWGEHARWNVFADGVWSDAEDADPSDLYRSRQPAVAGGPDGMFLGVWTRCCDVPDPLYWSVFDGAWSAPTPMSVEHAGRTSRGSVGLDATGSGFATWGNHVYYDYAGSAIWAARFEAGGFGPPERLFDVDAEVDTATVTAVDASGTAFVISETDTGLAARRFDGTSWEAGNRISGPVVLVSEWELDLSTDGRGGAVAAWIDDAHVWACRYRPGEGWDDAFVVDESDGLVTPTVRVAVAPDGTALIVWTDGAFPTPAAAVWAAVIPQ